MRLRSTTAEWRHLAMLTFEIDSKVLSPFIIAGTGGCLAGPNVREHRRISIPRRASSAQRFPFTATSKRWSLRAPDGDDGWRRARRLRQGDRAALRDCLDRENSLRRALRCRSDAAPHRGDRPCDRIADGVVLLVVSRARKPKIELCSRQYRRGCRGKRRGVHHGTLLGLRSTKRRRTAEYRVEHPRWQVCTATEAQLDCDVAALYGGQFVEFLKAPPASRISRRRIESEGFQRNLAPSREDR